MAKSNFESMSVEELISTRDEIDALLSSKVSDERRELQRQLSQLDRFSGGGRGGKRGVKAGSSVEPKFISLDGETWAGRGARPRWLRALLDAGRDVAEFAVDATGSGKNSSGRGKAQKTSSTGRGRGRSKKAAA